MLNRKLFSLTVIAATAAVVLAMPAACSAQGFGCTSCAAPVAVAPAYVGYAPQTYAYMPTSVYRALYRPTVVTAYQPVVGYSGYAYSTYRPLLGGWTYPARIVPYTTYQPVYYSAAPVAASVGYAPWASCSPCNSCSSPCGSACGTVSYGAPASNCSSCAAPATVVTPAPDTGENAIPPMGTSPQKTFEGKVEKPAVDTELKPIPQTDTRLNSMPAPLLRDPRDRTAAQTFQTPALVASIASANPIAPAQDADGWQPARD